MFASLPPGACVAPGRGFHILGLLPKGSEYTLEQVRASLPEFAPAHWVPAEEPSVFHLHHYRVGGVWYLEDSRDAGVEVCDLSLSEFLSLRVWESVPGRLRLWGLDLSLVAKRGLCYEVWVCASFAVAPSVLDEVLS